MEEVLWLKFAQHRRLADALVATEDAELIEVSTVYSQQKVAKVEAHVAIGQ